MTRHRFEPARLLLGLLLLGTAVTYAMNALGEWHVPLWALLALVPASLLAAAFVAVATFAVRRMLRRRRTAARRTLGGMPVDELRDGYEQLHKDNGGAKDQEGRRREGGQPEGGQPEGGDPGARSSEGHGDGTGDTQ
ncbi:hypothetical protein [Streptomyces marispadix]|uniref:DUF4229 domain-containing protein n=1 Tax=Streptomyces marispadix TaxID=2922868 RepID=A0ABS9T0T0_9ACTN|nr:hypothetical protein [Streptomyces marispadix]MCH6162138.1 hypothetical protein [Streptomyces marispadix]